jgi:hypothetical protein
MVAGVISLIRGVKLRGVKLLLQNKLYGSMAQVKSDSWYYIEDEEYEVGVERKQKKIVKETEEEL